MGRRKYTPAWKGLPRANIVDMALSVEADGTPTDIHRLTASKMYGIDYQSVTAEQRRAGKNANFSKIYGGTGWSRRYG